MSRYENDPERRKRKWWKLHELADAAVMVFGEEQRAKKGKFKIVSEKEEDNKRIRLFDHVPIKKRSWVKYSPQTYEYLNEACTSASLPHFRSFEPLGYNLDDQSKKRETKTPPTPTSHYFQSSCLTESTSRKERVLEMPQRKIIRGKLKKANVVRFPRLARETPEWLVQLMREMKRCQDPRLIFERSLSASDVNSGQSRLLIPFNMLTRNDFLTPAESQAIKRVDVDEENIGLGTILVNHKSEKWGLRFKIWAMEKKKSGNGTLNYALNWGWNEVVKCNGLEVEDEISLWTFRWRDVLCFALEHRPKSSI